MSRKEQLIVAEGISKKNILPQFGKNNEANTKTEDTFRKFMYDKKPITEAVLTENPLAAILGGASTGGLGAAIGGEAAGAAAGEAAAASGVTEPVMKGVGQAAMDLAAKGGDNEPSENQKASDISGTGVTEARHKLEIQPKTHEEQRAIAAKMGYPAWALDYDMSTKIAPVQAVKPKGHGPDWDEPKEESVVRSFLNDLTETLYGTETAADRGSKGRNDVAKDIKGYRKYLTQKGTLEGVHELRDLAGREASMAASFANEKKKALAGNNPDSPEMLQRLSDRSLSNAMHYANAGEKEVGRAIRQPEEQVAEATIPGEKLSKASRNDIAAELRGARGPHSSVTNKIISDLVTDEKYFAKASKEEGEPKSVVKDSEDRLAHYRLALGMRKGLMRKKMGF